MYKHILWALIALAFFTFNSCAPAYSQAVTEEGTVEEVSAEEVEEAPATISDSAAMAVVGHHLGAFGANDIEALMEDYAIDAVLMTADSTYTGHDEIRGLFTGMFALFPTGNITLEVDRFIASDGLVYIVWHGEAPTVIVPMGTDTFIFEGDKIKRQTFTAYVVPKATEP